MGCDIHIRIDQKVTWATGEYWIFARVESAPRNYALFGAMAGVRNREIGAVVEPRGNVSVPFDDDEYNGPDYHTHSWLTADEFQQAMQRAEAEHPEYLAVLAAMRALGPESRIVFCFDN
jgi:hypothetical protein